MFELGILDEDERVELIEGEILELEPLKPPHSGTVNRLNMLFTGRLSGQVIASVQNSIQLPPRSMPQPDMALLRPRDDFYSTSHPQAPDILLAVEVAYTSLRYDRDRKAPLYARYGIRDYWIVDVTGRVILTHSDPGDDGYALTRIVRPGEELSLVAFPDVVFRAEETLG